MKKLVLFSFILSGNIFAQSVWDLHPHDVRELINKKILLIEAEKPDVCVVNNASIKSDNRETPLRVYSPKSSQNPFPIILFIHGGAWVGGNLDTHDNLARYLCQETQALIISIDYCNSPEGKFPLPLEQCYDALLWAIENAQQFHADKNRLAIVGDSAGGNMAAALCLLARDRSGPTIGLQVLINPATDLTCNGTLQRQGDAFDTGRWYVNQYVANPEDVNNPYASPMLAKDLGHLPPALVILAEKDELREDGQKYANRLIAAGIKTNIYTQWNVGHLAGNAARAATVARESLDVAISALKGIFKHEHYKESRVCLKI